MKMANHPRPGDIIQEALDELNVSLREFARAMEIAPSTASRDFRHGIKFFRIVLRLWELEDVLRLN